MKIGKSPPLCAVIVDHNNIINRKYTTVIGGCSDGSRHFLGPVGPRQPLAVKDSFTHPPEKMTEKRPSRFSCGNHQ